MVYLCKCNHVGCEITDMIDILSGAIPHYIFPVTHHNPTTWLQGFFFPLKEIRPLAVTEPCTTTTVENRQ